MLSTTLKPAANKVQKGFTLIELLIVIGILAVLMGIVLIAINPARQFALSNNTKRRSDVKTILDSISQYMADNKGTLPAGLVAGDTNVEVMNGTHADLCNAVVPKYVAALPEDPRINNGAQIPSTACAAYDAGYQVSVSSSSSRVTVTAPNADSIDGVVPLISVTR